MVLSGCSGLSSGGEATAILADGSSGDDWPGYGRTFGQQHFSPLADVNTGNVGSLGLAWSMDLPAENSVTQPIAVDGVLYFASGLSTVHAVDAATGKELWSYDPQVGKVGGLNQRIGWGVRGVAWWDGMVYVGTRDGRLIAVNAKDGKHVWTAQTYGADDPAYISGAPRALGGKILIGFGSTSGAMRGYVSAYDAKTGKLSWRFYTVPGDPAKGFENKAMEMAAKTWSGEWWKYGGGGMVWNSMAYDPDANLVFIGVGSPYPWNHRVRSQGKGDNLFIGSIVALDGDTGEYRWHYQTVPGDTWDFDATMDIELADLEIDGKQRKVLMQAPKNGFFYVIDRITGKLISATPFVPTTWASSIDLKTGRPVENPNARYDKTGKPSVITPTALAAHNWLPMSFSPKNGLVFIPVGHWEARYGDIDYEFKPPADRTTDGGVAFAGGPLAGMPRPTGSLIAWSPTEKKVVWKVPHPTYLNGGVLSTAGGLVFQGTIDGSFKAYEAASGKVVWSFDAKAPMIAPPISYRAGGKQYVTVLTGMGMGYSMNAGSLFGPDIEKYGIDPLTQARRVLTFAIDGKGTLPPRREPPAPPEDPGFKPQPATVQTGFIAYETHCLTCHGDMAVGIGNGPDLRRSAVVLDKETFDQVVRHGALEERGMPNFKEFNDAKVEDIRHYLRSRAAELRGEGKGSTPKPDSLQIK
ncbi:MAG: PQQ-dependent dehydrogenase, methanol/ethanol family [Novosphingobium sp.]